MRRRWEGNSAVLGWPLLDSFRQKALRDLIHDKNTWSAAIVGLGSTLNSGQAEGTCFAKHRN